MHYSFACRSSVLAMRAWYLLTTFVSPSPANHFLAGCCAALVYNLPP